MHWTAVSGFKAARVAQQGQPSTRYKLLPVVCWLPAISQLTAGKHRFNKTFG